MPGTETKISTNMILKATQTDLREQAIENTFWGPLMVDNASENEKMDTAPEGVVERKTKLVKEGAKYIECGEILELEGEETTNDAQMVGNEEALYNQEARVYFTDVRHAVALPLKGINAWTNAAYKKLTDANRRLATWNKRVWESWMWQAYFKGVPDKVASAHAEAAQSWHPNIYVAEAAGLQRVSWSANSSTFQGSIATAMNALAAGDTVKKGILYDVEGAMADLKVPKVVVKAGGKEQECWIWAYPRIARKRMQLELENKFLYGDIRGPGNRAISGQLAIVGELCFIEAAYIPRFKQNGSVISLEEAWAFNSQTNRRVDNRANLQGVAHAVMGRNALWFVEPEGLQHDTEATDYKRKKGIATYRMMGAKRAETYDSYTNPTQVSNFGGITVLEHATTV